MKQAVLCVLLVAVVAAGWYLTRDPDIVGVARESAGGAGAEQGGNRIPGLLGGDRAVNVITAEVATDTGGERVVALGTAQAARSVVLYPQGTGTVTKILFDSGDAVAEGAVLLMLEDDQEQVAADRARIEYAQARSALERSQALERSKTISSVALADAEMTAQLAENGVRTAEIAVQRRLVVAPFAGIVGLTDISIGDLVTNTTPITTLADVSTIRAAFEVPERWAGRIAAGQPITAVAQGLPGKEFSGAVVAIDNRVDAATRTLKLEAELTNEDGGLKAGMAVTVTLEFAADQELAVPSLALQWDRRGSFVWKVVEETARRADVAVVKRESGVVIVTGDVAAGDKVVVEGTQRLRDGAKVAEVDVTPAMAADENDVGTPPAADVPAVSGAGAPAETRS